TAERRDLWRDLLPLVIALGPIDQAVRRGIGRARPWWAARGAWSRALRLITERLPGSRRYKGAYRCCHDSARSSSQSTYSRRSANSHAPPLGPRTGFNAVRRLMRGHRWLA